MKSVKESLLERRSIRRYERQPIEPEKLDFIYEAIRNAPTSYNGQQFSVIAVTDQALKEQLYEITGQKQIKTSAVFMVFCMDFHKLRLAAKQKGVDTDTIITAPDDYDASIYSISKYIEQHCGEPLRVHELAQMCGMSYSYFAKLFRETYNQSCKEYIEFTRINKAADLLLFTNQDLTYISQETGFADCSHLIRTFKKWKGMTPKQWKKSLK